MNVVVFDNGSPLYLTSVQRNPDGSLKSGYVENGNWDFEVRGDEHLAKDWDRVVSRWPASPLVEVPITSHIPGDYNDVIRWAEAQLSNTKETV